MLVGSVNITLYPNAMQYRYFDTTISDNQILSLMRKYGISPSGDRDSDLEALYSAMYPYAKEMVANNVENAQQAQQNKAQSAQQVPSDVPWAKVMYQAGLHVSGDHKKDYQAFTDKILEMKKSAATPQNQAMISQLISEAEIVFTPPSSSSESAGSLPSATGADITAMLNKLYFLG